MRRELRLTVIGLLISVSTLAQKSYQLGIGPTQILDTYLSQEKFKGTGLTFLATSEYGKTPNLKTKNLNWSWLWQHQLNLSKCDDRAEKGTELEGGYNLYVGRYHAWRLMDGNLKLQAGYNGRFSHENTPQESYIDDTWEGTTAQEDKAYYNRFIYDLDIHALYATASYNFGKFGADCQRTAWRSWLGNHPAVAE